MRWKALVFVAAILGATAGSFVVLNFGGDEKTESNKMKARLTMHVSDEMIKNGAGISVQSIPLPRERLKHLNRDLEEDVTHAYLDHKWNIIYFFYDESKEPIYSFAPSNEKNQASKSNEKILNKIIEGSGSIMTGDGVKQVKYDYHSVILYGQFILESDVRYLNHASAISDKALIEFSKDPSEKLILFISDDDPIENAQFTRVDKK